ncbi:hypothetical protein [Aquabacterium sp.]|uniref:hypothetical protein n=1 Tax=Aquabacterium sp. TaxID=1872578 RepID=UPI002E3468D0|nr:hypothetical protein [Aquabacterium sp.]HEX5312093.1 hypothetical protein [Aquabacterium sp.]
MVKIIGNEMTMLDGKSIQKQEIRRNQCSAPHHESILRSGKHINALTLNDAAAFGYRTAG